MHMHHSLQKLICFCLNNSSKPSNIQYTLQNDIFKEKRTTFHIREVETSTCSCVCLRNDFNDSFLRPFSSQMNLQIIFTIIFITMFQSESPKWNLQIALVVQPTILIPKTIHLLSFMTKKCSKSLNFRSWNQQMFEIFFLQIDSNQ